ncbi:MAG: hypothetical protein J6S85_23980, partial [Methanobrevibacter sp.]|nr:hypothetical protein [Methanobrevibacter sp.]
MIKADVSDTVKRRLNYNKICPVCGTEIKDFQDFQYVVFKRGVNKCYRFFHTFCLIETSEDREFLNAKEG